MTEGLLKQVCDGIIRSSSTATSEMQVVLKTACLFEQVDHQEFSLGLSCMGFQANRSIATKDCWLSFIWYQNRAGCLPCLWNYLLQQAKTEEIL